jgi:hypothetical protein
VALGTPKRVRAAGVVVRCEEQVGEGEGQEGGSEAKRREEKNGSGDALWRGRAMPETPDQMSRTLMK